MMFVNWNKSGYDKFSTQQRIIINNREKNEEIRKREVEKIKVNKEPENNNDDKLIVQNKASLKINETESYEIIQYTNNTIHVYLNGDYVGEGNNRENLRKIAQSININIHNGNGNAKNTRTLGNDIIRFLKASDK